MIEQDYDFDSLPKCCNRFVLIFNFMLCLFITLFFTTIFTYKSGESLSLIISELKLTTTDAHSINYTAVKIAYTQYVDTPFHKRNECDQLDPIIDQMDDKLHQSSSFMFSTVKSWITCMDEVTNDRYITSMKGESPHLTVHTVQAGIANRGLG